MIQGLGRGVPAIGIPADQHPYEVFCSFRHKVPTRLVEGQAPLQSQLGGFSLRLMIKRKCSTKKRVTDASEAPQVTGRAVRLFAKHLWSGIAQGSERLIGLLTRSDYLGKAEIGELGHRTICRVTHHDVLELDVSVDDAKGVQELNREGQLIYDFLGLVLGEFKVSALQVVKEVTAAHVLKNKVEVLGVFKYIHQPYDVRMFRHLHDVNFSPRLVCLDDFHVGLRHDFNGHFDICRLVRAEFHQTELTFADRAIDGVELVDIGLASHF